MSDRRYPRGLTKRKEGWRIRLGQGGRHGNRSFPPSTSQTVVEDALLRMRLSAKAGRLVHGDGTLAADVSRYLKSYFGEGRPGRAERERHLQIWMEALGRDTFRSRVTREDVSRTLQNWRGVGLSADTCNKRRAALMAFYNALDGKGGSNPIRDVPKFRVSAPLPRGIDYALIERALAKMAYCRTRARLKLMAYTGARPIQIARLRPEDWDEKGRTLLLHATDKGQGTKPHRVPLSAKAMDAMREFEDTEAWGPFTVAPMGRMWKAVAIPVGIPKDLTRPYDLRHSFGTEVYRTTGDLRITKDLLGQSSFAMAERYTLAAIPDRQREAITAVDSAARKRAKIAKSVASRPKIARKP